MALTELMEKDTERSTSVGKPVMVIVSPEGFPDYSERVRATANAQAPEGAKGFVVGETALPTPVEVKVGGNIIGGETRKSPLRTEVQTWYAHPVVYYN